MKSIFKTRRLLVVFLFVFLALSITIAVITFYGQNVGNFVVDVSDDLKKVGISISEDPDYVGNNNRLLGEVLGDARPTSQLSIISEYVTENNGSYKSPSGDYVGYTFYLRNAGDEVLSVEANIKITGVSRNVDEAIRVWVFDDGVGTVYKKTDTVEAAYPPSYSPTVDFLSKEVVMVSKYENFYPGQVKKFSIILFIEGEDPDCVNTGSKSIAGGSFKISMGFSSYKVEH